MDNPRRGSISGGYRLSVKISLLRSYSYAEAKGWDGLVCAFTESLKNSSLDEFIHLTDINIPGPQGRLPEHVRPVSYYTLDEVPELLLSMVPGVLWTGASHAPQQRPQVKVVTGVQSDGDHDGQGQQEYTDTPQERVVDRGEAEVTVSDWNYHIPQETTADGEEAEVVMSGEDHEQEIDEIRVSAAKVIQDAYRRHSEQERAGAARKIQIAYRHHLKRKSVVRDYWYLLRKRSREMKWSKGSRYYLLFRVPLAYILVCLDAIKAFSESEKKEAKKRMMTEGGRDLERLMEALHQHRYDSFCCTLYEWSNQFPSELLKKTVALQKKLSPSSKFHEGRSISDLQHAVLDVKDVVRSLDDIPGSIGTRNQIKKYWRRGWVWIIEE